MTSLRSGVKLTSMTLLKLFAMFHILRKTLFGEHCFSGDDSQFFWDCKNLILTVSIFVGLFIPALSVTVRRFHDFGVSGWMYCAFIVPYVISGFIEDVQPVLAKIIELGTFVVFCVYVSQKPNKRKNKFGSVPKK